MKRYYLLASLPPLSFTSNEPPAISVSSFWTKVQEETEELVELIHAILLRQDIWNLEKTLSSDSILFQSTIPEEKITKAHTDLKVIKNYIPQEIFESLSLEKWQPTVWTKYFEYRKRMAVKHKSCLFELLEWQDGLRTYMAHIRAENLGISLKQNARISQNNPDFQRIVGEYYKQSNPLESELYMDNERWKILDKLAIPYSFSDDEVVVYALKLLMLERWWAITQTKVDIFEKVVNG